MATYSATQFEKAVALIRDLPKDGPVKPSQDDQLLVSRPFQLVLICDFLLSVHATARLSNARRDRRPRSLGGVSCR